MKMKGRGTFEGGLLLDEGESFVGGAELWGVFVENDGDGNIF